MKDIKTFVIGFLTCACLFLIMGQTKQEADANMDANMEQVMKMANQMTNCFLLSHLERTNCQP